MKPKSEKIAMAIDLDQVKHLLDHYEAMGYATISVAGNDVEDFDQTVSVVFPQLNFLEPSGRNQVLVNCASLITIKDVRLGGESTWRPYAKEVKRLNPDTEFIEPELPWDFK